MFVAKQTSPDQKKGSDWSKLLHTWIGCEEVSLPFLFWVTQASLINERYVVCGLAGGAVAARDAHAQ